MNSQPALYSVTDEQTEHGPQRRVSLTGMHAGQVQAWHSDKRIVAVISGSQGGKTSWGPWWLWREIITRGTGDYLAVTASYDLFQLKMLPALREVFEQVLGIARYWNGNLEICQHRYDDDAGIWAPVRNRDGTPVFEGKRASDTHLMWARVITRSARAKSGLESSTALAAWLDEAGQDEFTIDAYDAIRRRLSLTRGRVLITTTPYNTGWLKQQIYDPWQNGDKSIEVINFPSVINPAFPDEEFEERRRTMASWKFKMFYEGQFDRPEGMIYNMFVDKLRENGGHKVKPFEIPVSWPRFVGIDPGAANMAKVVLAHDVENDTYYLTTEDLGGGKSTRQHSDQMKAWPYYDRIKGWWVGAKSEVQQRMDFETNGIRPVYAPPVHDVEAGIDRVIELFRTFRLYIFDDCVGTLDQLGTYRRELGSDGLPSEKIANKANYHYLDALRYVVSGVTDPVGVLFA